MKKTVKIKSRFAKNSNLENQIISESQRKKINEQSKNLSSGNTFYNVRYSGLDLEGNRYILISEEAVSDDQNSEIVKTKKMNLSLTWDHRALDGAPAAEFLVEVKSLLEAPYRLLV